MEEDGYRKQGRGRAGLFRGQIEGRVILDMEPRAAAQVAGILSEGEVDPAEPMVPEAVCELANMVIGNAVTQLNDQRIRIQSFPAGSVTEEQCAKAGQDSEATILSLRDTRRATCHLNISMRYQPAPRQRTPARRVV